MSKSGKQKSTNLPVNRHVFTSSVQQRRLDSDFEIPPLPWEMSCTRVKSLQFRCCRLCFSKAFWITCAVLSWQVSYDTQELQMRLLFGVARNRPRLVSGKVKKKSTSIGSLFIWSIWQDHHLPNTGQLLMPTKNCDHNTLLKIKIEK